MDTEKGWPDGELLGFDLETTGPDCETDAPVSFALIRFTGRVPVETVASLVNPGQPISEGAEAVHGISEELARSCGAPLADAVTTISDALTDASARGVPVVGMNVSFDLTIADRIARLLFGSGLTERGFCGPVLDVLVIDRHVDRYRKGSRKLAALCELYGVSQQNAHEAGDDVQSCVSVLLAMADKYAEIASATPAFLHEQQVRWHFEWAKEYAGWRERKGMSALPKSQWNWPFSIADTAPPDGEQLALFAAPVG